MVLCTFTALMYVSFHVHIQNTDSFGPLLTSIPCILTGHLWSPDYLLQANRDVRQENNGGEELCRERSSDATGFMNSDVKT